MDDVALLAELADPLGTMGYAAAGWSDPLPTLTGDPNDLVLVDHPDVAAGRTKPSAKILVHRVDALKAPEDRTGPYTAADKIARAAQADKYQAIALLFNDPSSRPKLASHVTDQDVDQNLDMGEWFGIDANTRIWIDKLKAENDPRWRTELDDALPDLPGGVTKTALAALTESRHDEIELGGKKGRVRAGDIKRVKGDAT